MPTFTKDSLPSHPDTWPEFRKRSLTKATRIDGPFEVETDEGLMSCPDGWLAVDSRGLPYPINCDEFEAIYVPAEETL